MTFHPTHSAVPGLICAFGFDAAGRGRRLEEAVICHPEGSSDGWIWLHLNFADWRCRKWLAQNFALPDNLVAELCDPPLRQCVNAWEGVLHGHLADFRREFDADSTEFAWLHFVLGARFLITGRVKA
ncbi:CorA family divalent cation transporter, partial [Nostoc sp. NIES-2111]